ncbi:MAG: ParB/RepB/Spo0J family partition protein [bacterium]|nr:ParB/RepB/Spo0J family partition protein [bacterium]
MKRKALGRGLSALLSNAQVEAAAVTNDARTIEEIAVDVIEANHWQPRLSFDDEALLELSESIRNQGVLQPLLVRRDPANVGRFQLIAGERRLRASRLAGLEKVPCLLLDAEEAEMLEIALVENIQRSNLSPVEEARAYKHLGDRFSMTQEQIADKVGKSREAVANALRLLNLPDDVLEMLDEGRISVGHAKVLLSLRDPERIQLACDKAIEEQWSVRRLEEYLRGDDAKPASSSEKTSKPAKEEDLYVSDLRRKLQEAFQTKVDIKMRGASKGKIEITFYDLDQLDHLLKQWRVEL